MKYFTEKKFWTYLKKMHAAGGHYQRAVLRIKAIIADINRGEINPLRTLRRTNHGETRISHCIKYDLNGFSRLITIQHEGVCTLMFAGKHEDCERWLNNKKGLDLAFHPVNKVMLEVFVVEDINNPQKRRLENSDFSAGKLIKKLPQRYYNIMTSQITGDLLTPFYEFESDALEDEVLEACLKINDVTTQELFFDVFSALKEGNIDAAKNNILLFEEQLKLVEEASIQEQQTLQSNDQFLDIAELETEYLKVLLESKDWYEWMLFLHPAQRKVVDRDFEGSAKLLGVSGSGKTCVIVHRAIRLAKKYTGERILVLTLNPALAKLIQELVNMLLDNSGQVYLAERIKICSFWELCKELLIKFETSIHRERIFDSKTDRHQESIDSVWEAFYKCEENNTDAEILLPIHQTLLLRGIYPMEYLKQEFDWIRSALDENKYEVYLEMTRDGRKIPIPVTQREIILKTLGYWDDKMKMVGAIDYLGLANKLAHHLDKLQPTFRCVLLDEIQDFGTLELQLVRQMVKEGENDLFLCGDAAQKVSNKELKTKFSNIKIPPTNILKINKNYRNSREILQASHALFDKNIKNDDYKSEDFELLNPEFANLVVFD